MSEVDYRVNNISLADFGRKEIELAEHEMPGLMACRRDFPADFFAGARLSVSLHMTIQSAVLIETFKALGAEVRCCSSDMVSTQDHAAAAIAREGSAAVFAWKGETLEEYWECILKAITWPDDDEKGDGCDLLIDDGGDMTLLIHEGVKAEKKFAEDGSLPDPHTTHNSQFKIIYSILARELPLNPMKWHRLAERIVGVSEENTLGVRRLFGLAQKSELLFPAITLNNSVTTNKLFNLYGSKHALPDGICRATDIMIAGKHVVISGFGDVGKGCAHAMKGAGAVVYITEVDPICALQAAMEGFSVVRLESVVKTCDIFITTTGNKNIILYDHMAQMKNNAIVGNMGHHFEQEVDMENLIKKTVREHIKPQVDRFIFPDDGHGVIVLAEGGQLNLTCTTGHPSFVMSASFTNQVLAQVELWSNRVSHKYKRGEVTILPKHIDEKVAGLHLAALDMEITTLTKDQADYIGVSVEGPFKPSYYRY
eukprot:gene5528-6087_t